MKRRRFSITLTESEKGYVVAALREQAVREATIAGDLRVKNTVAPIMHQLADTIQTGWEEGESV